MEVVYVGSGAAPRTLSDYLSEQRIRISDELRPRVNGLDISEDAASVAIRNLQRMHTRAHFVARELGIVAPLGEENLLNFLLSPP
jgi:methylase of polypeptide subunit release factors